MFKEKRILLLVKILLLVIFAPIWIPMWICMFIIVQFFFRVIVYAGTGKWEWKWI